MFSRGQLTLKKANHTGGGPVAGANGFDHRGWSADRIAGREDIQDKQPKRLVSMKVADVPLECIDKDSIVFCVINADGEVNVLDLLELLARFRGRNR